MEKQGLKLAVVGAGTMGGNHADCIARHKMGSLEAVFDVEAERAGALAGRFGAKPYTNYAALLATDVDMVFICAPNTLHAKLVVQALQAGKHVFCEKPLCLGLAEAREIKAAADAAGKRVFVGHNRRFAPVYLKAKQATSGKGFAPCHLNLIQNDGDMGGGVWVVNLATLGGFLYDTTIHFLDLAEFFLGPVKQLRALGQTACYDIPDDFVIQLEFENGGIGAITSCGHASWVYPFERAQVVGDHQSVITEELDSFRHATGLEKAVEAMEYTKLPFIEKWGYLAMHRHMLTALGQGTPAENDLAVGMRGVALVEACDKSAKAGGAPTPITF